MALMRIKLGDECNCKLFSKVKTFIFLEIIIKTKASEINTIKILTYVAQDYNIFRSSKFNTTI